MSNEKNLEQLEEKLKDLVLEWRFLSYSKEKLAEKIENLYNRGEDDEVGNTQSA